MTNLELKFIKPIASKKIRFFKDASASKGYSVNRVNKKDFTYKHSFFLVLYSSDKNYNHTLLTTGNSLNDRSDGMFYFKNSIYKNVQILQYNKINILSDMNSSINIVNILNILSFKLPLLKIMKYDI